MERLQTHLQGPILLRPVVHRDARGFFMESYRRTLFAELGIDDEFVQDNHSRSSRGVVRGMHFQPGQSKLIRCVRGAILDVVVDIRPDSSTFGSWEAWRLDDEENLELYCPDGFAHGFCVLSEVADVVYSCSSYYEPTIERGFAYNDPEIAVSWPTEIELSPSPRDAAAPSFQEVAAELRSSVRVS